MPVGTKFLPVAAAFCACVSSHSTAAIAGARDTPPPPVIRHHVVSVSLDPENHNLTANDRLLLNIASSDGRVRFTLAKSLKIEEIRLIPHAGDDGGPIVSFSSEDAGASSHLQRVTVQLPTESGGEVRLLWRYAGPINDPPREPRHLRFVTPSETSGHIGPEGVYLSSESGWYPDLDGSLASFSLSVETPDEWTAVSQGLGRPVRHCQGNETGRPCVTQQTWDTGPSEALTLVANRFAAKTRAWKGPNGLPVQLATYFLPENAALADEYLDATAKYLDAYAVLLGDYPFEKFAVVENFFASGLGMPSFTLLGSGSIKRHYVQPYALGHEIVHSWIGNSVLNRGDSGNWVEGMTTFLANYYWYELTGDQRQAQEQRRLMTQGYSLHVEPDQEYPLGRFNRKSDERDNAIGYQKSAMVFQMLRQEMGEERFWCGVKQLVKEFRGRYAEWTDLERVFTAQHGSDLRWFFAQWVERAGAPVVSVAEARATPLESGGQAGSFRLRVRLQQSGQSFRLAVPLNVAMAHDTKTVMVPLGVGRDEVDVVLPERPLTVAIDPAFTVLRRLGRDQMAPVLNLFVTDRRKAVLPAFAQAASPLRELVARMAGQDGGQPLERRTAALSADTAALPSDGSVLVLATPDHREQVQALAKSSCGDRVALREEGFEIDGTSFEGPTLAVLFSCHRPEAKGSVLTVFYAVTPEAASKPARLLFFYGWHSYIVFQEGAAAARELWQVPHATKEVRLDGVQ